MLNKSMYPIFLTASEYDELEQASGSFFDSRPQQDILRQSLAILSRDHQKSFSHTSRTATMAYQVLCWAGINPPIAFGIQRIIMLHDIGSLDQPGQKHATLKDINAPLTRHVILAVDHHRDLPGSLRRQPSTPTSPTSLTSVEFQNAVWGDRRMSLPLLAKILTLVDAFDQRSLAYSSSSEILTNARTEFKKFQQENPSISWFSFLRASQTEKVLLDLISPELEPLFDSRLLACLIHYYLNAKDDPQSPALGTYFASKSRQLMEAYVNGVSYQMNLSQQLERLRSISLKSASRTEGGLRLALQT